MTQRTITLEQAMQPKQCSICKQTKHGSEFRARPYTLVRRPYCRPCENEYRRVRALAKARAMGVKPRSEMPKPEDRSKDMGW